MSRRKIKKIYIGFVGASFVHAHMLNFESRKYFRRAFMSSGCVSNFHLRKDNHLPILQECLQMNKTGNELAKFLKTASRLELSGCNYLPWIISMESPNAPQPFISQTPAEIYKSDKAPVMDAIFTISSQVFNLKKKICSSKFIQFPRLILIVTGISRICPRSARMDRAGDSRIWDSV